MTTKEIKEELHGHEVLSIRHEGTVGITDGEAWMNGKRIAKPDWKALWREYVEQELGPYYGGIIE